jgi:UPF0755 protein
VADDTKLSSCCSVWKKVKIIIVVFTFLFLCSGLVSGYFALSYFKKPGPLHKTTKLFIPQGSSLKAISKILADNSVIKYPNIFTLIVRFHEGAKDLKAGEYQFEANISPVSVVNKIIQGDVVIYNLTIPEGLMTFQILQIIKDAPYMTDEVLSDVKEGSLLPETYDYRYGDSRSSMIIRMQNMMSDVLDKAWANKADNLPLKSKEEALILASIIEKETSIESERTRVSAVFINRLRNNMLLQTDPTVVYAVTEGRYVLDRPLSNKDLGTDSPYNTYKKNGLPPTPISNPGKASIAAALNPIDSKELYFVADGTGGHRFAATLQEHNKNVHQWRTINKNKNNVGN